MGIVLVLISLFITLGMIFIVIYKSIEDTIFCDWQEFEWKILKRLRAKFTK